MGSVGCLAEKDDTAFFSLLVRASKSPGDPFRGMTASRSRCVSEIMPWGCCKEWVKGVISVHLHDCFSMGFHLLGCLEQSVNIVVAGL